MKRDQLTLDYMRDPETILDGNTVPPFELDAAEPLPADLREYYGMLPEMATRNSVTDNVGSLATDVDVVLRAP